MPGVYEEIFAEEVSKHDCKFWGIDDTTKCSVNVVAVLEDICERKGDAHTPKVANMSHESGCIKDRWTGIGVALFRARNEGVG